MKCFIKSLFVFIYLVTINSSVLAIEKPIYSYMIGENGEINLWSVTIPSNMETLNIPEQIGDKAVFSIDDNFLVREIEREDIRSRRVWSNEVFSYKIKHLAGYSFCLKNVIIPCSIKKISGNMVDDFKKIPISVEIPNEAEVTSKTSLNFYKDREYEYYYSLSPSQVFDKPNISEAGISVSLYIDGKYIDGAVLYNGVTYVDYKKIGNENKALESLTQDENIVPRISTAYLPDMLRSNPRLMILDCKQSRSEKYLNDESAYTSKENSAYELGYRRIMFNEFSDEVTIFEYYQTVGRKSDLDDPTFWDNMYGVLGGEITKIDMPVYEGYVPVRLVCEAAQMSVEWDNETQTVYVTSKID